MYCTPWFLCLSAFRLDSKFHWVHCISWPWIQLLVFTVYKTFIVSDIKAYNVSEEVPNDKLSYQYRRIKLDCLGVWKAQNFDTFARKRFRNVFMVPLYKAPSVMTFSRVFKRFTKEGHLKSKSPSVKVFTGVTQEKIYQVKNFCGKQQGIGPVHLHDQFSVRDRETWCVEKPEKKACRESYLSGQSFSLWHQSRPSQEGIFTSRASIWWTSWWFCWKSPYLGPCTRGPRRYFWTSF